MVNFVMIFLLTLGCSVHYLGLVHRGVHYLGLTRSWCALFGIIIKIEIMQQRAVPAGEVSGQQGGEPVAAHSYPEVNPLMPSSLKTVPPWYEGTNFRHNSRLLVGVVPGAVLLLTVTGTT